MRNNSSKTSICRLKFIYVSFHSVLSTKTEGMTVSYLAAGGFSISCTEKKLKVITLIWKKYLSSDNFKMYIYQIFHAVFKILSKILYLKPLSHQRLKTFFHLCGITYIKQIYAGRNFCNLHLIQFRNESEVYFVLWIQHQLHSRMHDETRDESIRMQNVTISIQPSSRMSSILSGKYWNCKPAVFTLQSCSFELFSSHLLLEFSIVSYARVNLNSDFRFKFQIEFFGADQG